MRGLFFNLLARPIKNLIYVTRLPCQGDFMKNDLMNPRRYITRTPMYSCTSTANQI